MSSPRPARLAAVAVLGLVTLAGCQVRPLYAPTSVEAGPQADLPAIKIDWPGSRTEQTYRNALIFGLRGGADAANARFSLSFRMLVNEQGIVLERGTGTPNAYQLTGSVSFLLKDIASGESLFGAEVTATDSYTRSSQNFANTRAQIDAQDRLAKSLAQLTQARLAAYFATH